MNTEVIRQFKIEGNVVEVKPLGEGFINDTFIVRTSSEGPDYILQRKNHKIFPDVPAMMDNIVAVTNHIKNKVSDPLRETLTVVPTVDGKNYCLDDEGNYWAVCILIPDTITYTVADTLELVRQGGIGIGRFQTLLSDFDKPLAETIPGFHNLAFRFSQWDECLRRDAAGRKAGLSDEIYFIEARRQEFLDFWKLIEDGTIPRRVAHNDTKLSNILFDEPSGEVLCAIDLDTVMSSTSLCDVGDAIRTYTSSTIEDDPDYGSVRLCLDKFQAYMDGYLSERRDTLTESEKEWLPFAGLYLTYEQTLRFLMDYIDGDTYYKIRYPEHNLVRTRSQMALLRSMEDQYEQMKQIVKDLL
ncbi:MAG: aminoglycoside phosphotransferase family protein [Candidatus Cryptobacteroides sp.]|nr:aminoglycoside phosphotransferase family protein [Candidatus Cryptobacteroides sp.]